MADVPAFGFRVLNDFITEGPRKGPVESKTSTRIIGEVVLEGSSDKDLRFVERNEVDGDPTVIQHHNLTGCFDTGTNPTRHVIGEVVKGSVEETNDLVHSRRFTEIDPVIVSDVGVGDGLINISSAGGNHATGSKSTGTAAGQRASLKRGFQSYTDSGKMIMRETRMAQANEADMQIHSRGDRCHAVVPETTKTENIPEIWPFFIHQFGSQEKGKFAVSDLVWGKVKSHPWWPGQIIDPSDASALAIKCQKKDALLVAYFWDKTFAWCDESQLKPFFSNFSAFEAQADLDVFNSAVKSALKEICRRIDTSTLCSCLKEKSLFKIYPYMENAGVREGFKYYTVDKSKVVNSWNSRGLVCLIRDLALNPCNGSPNKLSLVMSKYHIKGFNRWMAIMLEKQTKPVLVSVEGVNLPKNTASLSDASISEIPVMQINPSTPHTTPVVNSSTETTPVVNLSTEMPKKKRGRPRKTPATAPVITASIEASSDLSSRTNTGPGKRVRRSNKAISGKRHKVCLPETSPDKRVQSNNIQDSTYLPEMNPRVQDDAQLVVSAAKRPAIIPLVDKKSDECIPTALVLSFSSRISKAPSDVEILRIFSKYGPLKGEMEKEVEGSQSRFKLVFKKLADAEVAFGSLRMQNVFGSSLISYRLIDLPSSEVANSSESEMVEVNGEDHSLLEERAEETGELNPTTLLLIFSTKSSKTPSEMELIRMFSHHGPLKEKSVEKEVEGTTCRFRIAFKKHSSAQMAFTSLRKQNVFGPSLLSYRLVNLPVAASKNSGDVRIKEPNKEKHNELEKLVALREHLVQFTRAIVDNRTVRPLYAAVGLASTVQSDSVTDISVDPSSIAHGGSSGDISVAPSSTRQGMNVDEISTAPVITISDDVTVDPQSKRQDADAVVKSLRPSNSVQGADMTEMSIHPQSSFSAAELLVASSHTIKACEILTKPFPRTMQAGSRSDSVSTEGKTIGDVLIISSKIPGGTGGGDKMQIDSLSSGEGKAICEVPIDRLFAEDGEVGDRDEIPSNLSNTREEAALFEMQIDPSRTGQNQEPRQKKLDNLKTEKQAAALAKSISNGAVLLECTPSRSATGGCNTTPRFQKSSPIWQPLESLELFTRTTQQPHFKKLDGYCQEMRDGMAIGLMVTYANLTDSIKKLSFDDDVAAIEQKRTCLEALEENGFDVDLIRTRLNQILQIKTDGVRSTLKLAEMEKELAKKESEAMSTQRLIEKTRSDMAKLEEQINALTEQSRTLVAEKDQLLELTVGNGHEISRLKNELSIVNRLLGSAPEEFAQVC